MHIDKEKATIIGAILGLAQYLFIRNKIMVAYVLLIMFPVIWAVSTSIMEASVSWLQIFGVFFMHWFHA